MPASSRWVCCSAGTTAGFLRCRHMVPHDKQSQIAAVEAFLTGLTKNDVQAMPLADDILLTSPLDPEHPARGRKDVIAFLEKEVFPKVPVASAKVERHIVEGDPVAQLWA